MINATTPTYEKPPTAVGGFFVGELNMDLNSISLELLTENNIQEARSICREDISEDFVDTVDDSMKLTQYGLEQRCLGHTYAVRYGRNVIGVILLGEAIPWETDPEEMRDTPFYRLMGFVIDRRYRGGGVGAYVLNETVRRIYQEFGVRPIALGCHKDNADGERFWLRHGFRRAEAMEGDDCYYLRYPS